MTLRNGFVYGLAALLGVALAWPPAKEASEPPGPPVTAESSASADGSATGVVGRLPEVPGTLAEGAHGARASRVFAASGLQLVAAHGDTGFLGYMVSAQGTDRRFRKGQLITAIGGRPVEDSAAGGELLIAGLRAPDAVVSVADWGQN